MTYIKRTSENLILKALNRKKSVLLLGPRQTGKTTLIERMNADLTITFLRPEIRQRYEQNPSILINELQSIKDQAKNKLPLVILDEVQKVPDILNVVQEIIDQKHAQFILTGSSARKLYRHRDINLLPGRVVSLRLDPLTLTEYPGRSLEDYLLFEPSTGM